MNFNPTLVQLEFNPLSEASNALKYFNPTLVQLESGEVVCFGNLQINFNPTLVQLEFEDVLFNISRQEFQSHIGAIRIGMNGILIGIATISIPHWCN